MYANPISSFDNITCPPNSVNTSSIQIANNQILPNNYEMIALSTILKSNPQFIVCPHCKGITPTRTEKSLSFKNALLFCLGGPFIWGLVQMLRNKDLNCYDANHYCLKCNANLGNYKAC